MNKCKCKHEFPLLYMEYEYDSQGGQHYWIMKCNKCNYSTSQYVSLFWHLKLWYHSLFSKNHKYKLRYHTNTNIVTLKCEICDKEKILINKQISDRENKTSEK